MRFISFHPPQPTAYHAARYQLQLYLEYLHETCQTEKIFVDDSGSVAMALTNGDQFFLRLDQSGEHAISYFKIDLNRAISPDHLPRMSRDGDFIGAAPRITLFGEQSIVISISIDEEPVDLHSLDAAVKQLHASYLDVKSTLR